MAEKHGFLHGSGQHTVSRGLSRRAGEAQPECVYYALLGNFNLRGLYSPQTQTIVALLHDVCKANYYAGEYPDYAVKDQMPMGHGEKSVYLVMKHMELTDDEALAIRWHMGAYDDAFRGGSRALNAAMERTPLVLELHYADMIATQREKNEEVL